MKKTRTTAKVKDIAQNDGQLDWLPRNPRQWTKADIEKTAASLERDPDFLEDRPILLTPEMIAFAGNLRLTAAKQIKRKEVPVIIYTPETDEDYETIKRRTILDNGSFGAWDYDALANEWDNGHLTDWGVPAWDTFDAKGEDSGLLTSGELDDLVNNASEGSIVDYNEDTDYDLTKLYRMVSNPEVVEMLEEGENNNEVRPEIAKLCRNRIAQCTIFNFDQIIKFYRSEDSTPTERELLKRLYLVFITPREAVESAMLDLVAETGKIYELEISRGEDIGEEEE